MNIKKDIERQKAYKEAINQKKRNIRKNNKGAKRFFKMLWFYLLLPFYWFKDNLKDFKTLIIFLIVLIVLSSEVWVFYLLALLSWGSSFSKWCLGIGSSFWLFWLAPFTPFLPICIFLTMLIKGILNKIIFRKELKQ